MARKPRVLPDGRDWVGKRVRYTAHEGQKPEHGTVERMATGKALAMFVLFDGEKSAKYCYETNLEVIE